MDMHRWLIGTGIPALGPNGLGTCGRSEKPAASGPRLVNGGDVVAAIDVDGHSVACDASSLTFPIPASRLRAQLIDCQDCQESAHRCPREHGFRFLPQQGPGKRAEGSHCRDTSRRRRGAEPFDELADSIGLLEKCLVMRTEVAYMEADRRPLRPSKIRSLSDRQTHARHETCIEGMFNLMLLHA